MSDPTDKADLVGRLRELHRLRRVQREHEAAARVLADELQVELTRTGPVRLVLGTGTVMVAAVQVPEVSVVSVDRLARAVEDGELDPAVFEDVCPRQASLDELRRHAAAQRIPPKVLAEAVDFVPARPRITFTARYETA